MGVDNGENILAGAVRKSIIVARIAQGLADSLLDSEAHRHQLRNARLLHGHAVENGRDAHGLLAVRDEHELGLHAHLLDQFGEAADVGLVERRVDFVEDAERAGRVLENADQQGQRSERLFAAGEQQHALQALARRRSHDVDAALGAVLFVGELHEARGRRRRVS